jgi:hypothetical protein
MKSGNYKALNAVVRMIAHECALLGILSAAHSERQHRGASQQP